MIYYQNGVQNTEKGALEGARILSNATGIPAGKIGIINNKTAGENPVGLVVDLNEFSRGDYKLMDVLNAHQYEQISKNGEKNTIVLFSAGNKDALNAMKVLDLSNKSLNGNVSFVSVGSPVKSRDLETAASKVGATVSGQYNTWKDPVANSMGWVAGTGGTVVTGAIIGGMMGLHFLPKGLLMSAYFGALTGGSLGSGLGGGALLYSVSKQHSFENYMSKDIQGLRQDMMKLGLEQRRAK